MVSKKDMTLIELLEQKVFDEKLKIDIKEAKEIQAEYDKIFPDKEYREFIKKDRHSMAYTVKQEVEEWWQTAPLRLHLDFMMNLFWLGSFIYVLIWMSIGFWFVMQMLGSY